MSEQRLTPGDRAIEALMMEVNRAVRTAVEDEREACAMIHESINVACDHERTKGLPGGASMGAVIEYRDAIRARGQR